MVNDVITITTVGGLMSWSAYLEAAVLPAAGPAVVGAAAVAAVAAVAARPAQAAATGSSLMRQSPLTRQVMNS
jgi:hypothetical protein